MSSIKLEDPDCPLKHKCEKCGDIADTVTCMYHVPSKQVKYRYLCHDCYLSTALFQIGMGFKPVNLEDVQ